MGACRECRRLFMFDIFEPKVRNLVERIPRDTAYHLSQSSPYLRDNPMRERRKSEGHADALGAQGHLHHNGHLHESKSGLCIQRIC